MEIEIKVTVIWKNKKNLKIFTEKVDSVQFTLDEFSIVQIRLYLYDTKKFFARNQAKGERCMSVSSDEESED